MSDHTYPTAPPHHSMQRSTDPVKLSDAILLAEAQFVTAPPASASDRVVSPGRDEASALPFARTVSDMDRSESATSPTVLIGFGTDSDCRNRDATKAAVRAVQDALNKGSSNNNDSSERRKTLKSGDEIKIKLGVPVAGGSNMSLDRKAISMVVPSFVTVVSPIETVLGGLSVNDSNHNENHCAPFICSVVAYVTIVQPISPGAGHVMETVFSSISNDSILEGEHVSSYTTTTSTRRGPSSMDLLAQISEEVRRKDLMAKAQRLTSSLSRPRFTATSGDATSATPVHGFHTSYASIERQMLGVNSVRPSTATSLWNDLSSSTSLAGLEVSDTLKASASNGVMMVTGKKHVCPAATSSSSTSSGCGGDSHQHQFYEDHADEQPTAQDGALVLAGKLYTAAFPVKLHEIISKVEADGLGHIFGWQPHGRCFKIHQSEYFSNVILPQYFNMTKKSSFLRQLNLYGFNRLSTGPDKGAYYHELFLRGMQFLCRRMSRNKVNGNGIRQASNPEMEPQFYQMRSVPLQQRNELTTTSNEERSVHNSASTLHLISSMSSSSSSGSSQSISSSSDCSVASGAHPEEHQEHDASPPVANVVTTEDEPASGSNSISAKSTSLPSSRRSSSKSTGTKSKRRGSGGAGGAHVSFPLKLHNMLDQLEREGTHSHIISWLPHGRAFVVKDPEAFVEELMPRYFRQTKFSSFQRQLHMYAFQRITRAGRDKGGYFHASFLRGNPDLCRQMVRTRINGKGCRKPSNPSNEPEFWTMDPMPGLQ